MLKRKTLAWYAVAIIFAGTLLFPVATSAQDKLLPPATTPAPAGESPLASFLAIANNQTPRDDQRFWFSAEYMFAFIRGSNVPTLVTTSPAGTDRTVAGILGPATTTPLFGGEWTNDGLRPGVRFETGYWFARDSVLGLEAGFTMVGGDSSLFSANSNQFPILARPYTSSTNLSQQAVLVAFPGSSTGSIDAHVTSGTYYAGNLDIAEKAIDEGWFRLIALVGWRIYGYDESLGVRQTLNTTNPAFAAGTQAVTSDSFTTSNTFNGLDLGFRSQFYWDQFSLEILTRVAVGDLERRININGQQTVTVPGAAPVTTQGGVLALSSNSAQFNSHDWKAMPEIGFTLGWQVRPNVTLRAGYSFTLLSGVVRAADIVDTTINPNLFPGGSGVGAQRPIFNLNRSDMWIQSLNVGMEFTY